MSGSNTTQLQECLDRLREGSPEARAALLEHSQQRLRLLTRKMLRHYPNVRRWEETDDVFQAALVRLDRMLQTTTPETVLDYLRLASTQIRRELIDLARRHSGPAGDGANHATPARQNDDSPEPHPVVVAASSDDPVQLAAWAELHRQIGLLAAEQRETFDLLWYHGLTQDEAAAALGVSLSTLKRRWQSARLALMDALGGELPF